MKRIKQIGVTLLELLLVLSLIAAFLLALTRLYQVVEGNYKVNQAATIVQTLYQAAAQYSALPVTTDLLADFIAKGYVPNTYANPGSNPWGGDITANALSVSQLQASLTAVPYALCQNLQAKFASMNNASAACVNRSLDEDLATFQVTFSMDVVNNAP